MKSRRFSIDWINALCYCAVFLEFLCLCKLEKDVSPYSISFYVSCLYSGLSPIVTPVAFLLPFVIFGKTGLLPVLSLPTLFFAVIFPLYKRKNRKPKFELFAYCVATLVPYMIFGDLNNFVPYEKRAVVCIVNLVFLPLFIKFMSGFIKRGLKVKPDGGDYLSLCVFTVATGLGICNLSMPSVYLAIAVFAVLLTGYLFDKGFAVCSACALGTTFAVYYGNVNYLSVFFAYGLATILSTRISRYLSCIAILFCDYAVQFVFSVYPSYGPERFLPVIIGAILFCVTPTPVLDKIKSRIFSFREKQIYRKSINQNRAILASKLYDLSSVFTEMSDAFSAFGENGLNEDSAKRTVIKKVKDGVCKNCIRRAQCSAVCFDSQKTSDELYKLVNIGFKKGRLSLIDFPNSFVTECIHPNEVLFSVNKMLSEYRAGIIDNKNAENGRNLIADESRGVAEVLRGLALETGALLKYGNKAENDLRSALLKNGFDVSEILIYGENERLSIGIILSDPNFSAEKLVRVVNDCLQIKSCVCEKNFVTEDKVYIRLKKRAEHDAVFGICGKVKDGSVSSGDTHSITRISDDKFLVALSDGMGSGEKARKVSSASLSLIESFYKAGLSGNLVLSTVNKLLSINSEDTFSALDVSVIDLKSCTADFIKYGSPYGFIIGESGIKIVEGNTLPLGILDDLKPSVCRTEISDGDVLLFLTDGVSDAFGSSSDVIDFLKSSPAFNPQTLADDIIARAIELSGGAKKDDMTALAVRIFKKEA